MVGEPELRREILVAAYEDRDRDVEAVAAAVDCSVPYVETVLERYEGPDEVVAGIERLNAELGLPRRAELPPTASERGPVWAGVGFRLVGSFAVAGVTALLGAFLLLDGSLAPSVQIGVGAVCSLFLVGVVLLGSHRSTAGDHRDPVGPTGPR